MKKLITLLLVIFTGLSVAKACDEPDNEDLVKKAAAIIDETAHQQYAKSEGEKKISTASVLPKPDEKNVVITFTIDEQNKIHVVEVQGGYAFINHYIKTSLEGKEIKTENAIPGINYMMSVKLPTSV
ncbi:MAG: hypothetical protein IPL12_10695 [Bacteroidetes bacterium]|nr:hypothetical protein [Bacteroidota bacterium]MBK8343722.1 hypothetical protein [Bacteroidota bacterium]